MYRFKVGDRVDWTVSRIGWKNCLIVERKTLEGKDGYLVLCDRSKGWLADTEVRRSGSTLDLSKPVECNGQPVKILTTSNPGNYPVVGSYPCGKIGQWTKEGVSRFSSNDLVNVPPPKRSATRWVSLTRDGRMCLSYNKPRIGDYYIGAKKVTVTEGDGIDSKHCCHCNEPDDACKCGRS